MTNTLSNTDTHVLAQNPFFTLATEIVHVYSDAVRQNMEDLTVSSAKILQEQTMQAWTNAAQSCSKALAENAMSNQQRAIERITEANQHVFRILAEGLSPLKMQPIAGLANWMPPMISASSNLSEAGAATRVRRRR